MKKPSTAAATLLGAVVLLAALNAASQPAEPVLALAKKEKPALLETLKDLVSIESGSRDTEGLEKISALVADRLKALGGKVEFVTPGADTYKMEDTPPKIGRNTEARVSYDWSHAEGSYFYGVVPGGPLPAPSQLPNVFNKLQQLHIDVRHRVSNRIAATLSYLYEPFDVFDFAFDQSVVNSIVQPGALVMGYIYRPYTAHSVMFGIRYFW